MKFSTKISLFVTLFILLLSQSHLVFAQMEFVENKGQWNNQIKFKGEFKTGAFFLQNNGFTVVLNRAEDVQKKAILKHGAHLSKINLNPSDSFHSHAYKVNFVGANPNPEIVPEKMEATYSNYFIGNDKSKWAGNCRSFTSITYKNIYPNIDIRYYSTFDKLKYDFIVYPGGDPNKIIMRYNGVEKLNLKDAELVVSTSVGDVKELSPYCYQTSSNGSKIVPTKYRIMGNDVNFDVAQYNKNETLVIDPQLIFSSFTGSTADNWGYTATPGPDGSFFAGGITFGTGFPVSMGAYQTSFSGGDYDISILKFSPNGKQRLYATYIGGNGDEQPHSMIADANGNLIIAGRTNSSNYPLLTNIPATGSQYDIVVTKLNAGGTAIIGSAKIGGTGNDGINIKDKNNYIGATGDTSIRRNYGDDARSEVILDNQNNVVLVSCTQSNNFPTAAALQPTSGGAQDAVIVKFTPNLSSFIFSTYYGGSGDDAAFVAAINPLTGNLYVGGATTSTNLGGSSTNTINPTFLGGIDGYVTAFSNAGNAIIKKTFIGTTDVDMLYGLKFDRFGFPYIMGTTTGSWVPTANAIYNTPNSKQFIAKLEPDLSSFIYSTNFGTDAPTPNISPIAFLVDRCENVYVSGWGGNVNSGYSNSGTIGLPEVSPIAPFAPDGSDFYFFVLKKNAQAQLFGSHFGQNGAAGEHVDGGTSRFDANGVIYQAMCANCLGFGPASFPIFPSDVWGPTNPSPNCNLAAVKIDLDFAGVATELQSSINGVLNDTVACFPILVSFRDTLQKGVTYFWNFDSQNFPNNTDAITTVPDTSHLYTSPGIFRVRLISEDSSTCNIRDTSYITITVSDRSVDPSFIAKRVQPCTLNKYTFENTSTTFDGSSFVPTSFVWDYGDGSPKDTSNKLPIREHTYASLGTYFVTMTVIDPRYCNAPITDTVKIIVEPNVKAIPEVIQAACAPATYIFKNNSLFATGWEWQFINEVGTLISTSTLEEPSFTFSTGGVYKYRLIASNPNTCNLSDTSQYITVKIAEVPVALFDYLPRPSEPNVPVSFRNLTTNANSYLWNFGDGATSTLFEPIHEYNKTGNYKVVLYAYNNLICLDTFSLVVDVIINPLLDVPNAFTPGKFGTNGIVYVRGFGIEKMEWKIYNRWGELVFQSNNKLSGWDGFYKGKLQPMDVYTYTLDAVFVDGQKKRQTGDITLLR